MKKLDGWCPGVGESELKGYVDEGVQRYWCLQATYGKLYPIGDFMPQSRRLDLKISSDGETLFELDMNDGTKSGCWRMLGTSTGGKWVDIVDGIPPGQAYFPVMVSNKTTKEIATLTRCETSAASWEPDRMASGKAASLFNGLAIAK